MHSGQNGNGHERFDELCALAMSGSLTVAESADLQHHLQICGECRDEYERYLLLTREGIPLLAERYAAQSDVEVGSLAHGGSPLAAGSANATEKILARIAAAEHPLPADPSAHGLRAPSLVAVWRTVANPLTGAAAACLLVILSYGAYRFAQRTDAAKQAETQAKHRADTLAVEKKALAAQLTAQTQQLAQLESDSSQKRQEIDRLQSQLQSELRREEQRATELTTALTTAATATKTRLEDQLRAVSHDREMLTARLHELEVSYQSAQVELVNLRAERDRATLRLASLESENNALVASSRDQERRLRNQEQYLASDRDIRELMGARQLYMADVFDVSSDSRTRKPYGRVFYTKSKSLVFYAFDLDRQPGIKNAAFQAWGRNESSQGAPVNLGILYQDSEQNRRWVLRFDDPQRLAEIDAVFVTIEPHGGSNKPTGKPFLYASLRREPNHP